MTGEFVTDFNNGVRRIPALASQVASVRTECFNFHSYMRWINCVKSEPNFLYTASDALFRMCYTRFLDLYILSPAERYCKFIDAYPDIASTIQGQGTGFISPNLSSAPSANQKIAGKREIKATELNICSIPNGRLWRKFATQTVLNMQNRIITSIFCATLTIAAMAQTEVSDSIKTQNLDEVVVEAQMQRTSPTSTTYIPTGKQKNASQNAVDLLRQMAIPQSK